MTQPGLADCPTLASMPDDDAFCEYVGGHLADLPGVQAVTLGGSRATGNHRPDSDWDFAVYYRGAFTPISIRSLGWPGEVSEIRRPTRLGSIIATGSATPRPPRGGLRYVTCRRPPSSRSPTLNCRSKLRHPTSAQTSAGDV